MLNTIQTKWIYDRVTTKCSYNWNFHKKKERIFHQSSNSVNENVVGITFRAIHHKWVVECNNFRILFFLLTLLLLLLHNDHHSSDCLWFVTSTRRNREILRLRCVLVTGRYTPRVWEWAGFDGDGMRRPVFYRNLSVRLFSRWWFFDENFLQSFTFIWTLYICRFLFVLSNFFYILALLCRFKITDINIYIYIIFLLQNDFVIHHPTYCRSIIHP